MEIISAIPEYIITAVVAAAFAYGFKFVESLIHEKTLHVKTAQSKELWSFLEQIAMTAVNSLINAPMTGDAKFDKATTIVQETLNRQGFKNVNLEAINTAVQAAYEKSDLTHSNDPVFAAIAKAPNRANKVEKAKG
ncbi:phage holin, LLH family [Limosilactobacillus portuensis]|uniref:phage holin, LLH family n=1 Tax=Limosilactobacillus portuensis TaxID=2742601 RepID=UPI003D740202